MRPASPATPLPTARPAATTPNRERVGSVRLRRGSDLSQPGPHDPRDESRGHRMVGREPDRATTDAEAQPDRLIEIRLADHVDGEVVRGRAEIDDPLAVLLVRRDAVADALGGL